MYYFAGLLLWISVDTDEMMAFVARRTGLSEGVEGLVELDIQRGLHDSGYLPTGKENVLTARAIGMDLLAEVRTGDGARTGSIGARHQLTVFFLSFK